MTSSITMECDAFDGPRGPSPGRFRVRPPGGEPDARVPALTAVFELTLGRSQAVCGCLPVREGALSRVERRAVKLTLLENLIGVSSIASVPDALRSRPLTMEIGAGSLGKPVIRIGDAPGPSVSFSLGTGMMWAAVCREGACGIDSARPEEFCGGYPLHRAFRDEEFPAILELTEGNREDAAAILWSAKEAAVKALGCGFHLLDPLEVGVFPVRTGGVELMSKAVISGRFHWKQGLREEMRIPVLTFQFKDSWVSAACSIEEHSSENPTTAGRESLKEE